MGEPVYAFDLKLLCGGYAYYSTYTLFSRYSKKNREVREPSLVDSKRFLESLNILGQSTIIIYNKENYNTWLYLKGWALVPSDIARTIMPQWLKKKSCLTSPLGIFTDTEIASPSSLKRSYSQQKKEYVISRDKYACVLCGATDNLTMQHIRPYSMGGETSSRNMVTLCHDCNQLLKAEHVYELYRLGGLHYHYDPSLIHKKEIDNTAFHKAVQFSNNLMQTRCEVW